MIETHVVNAVILPELKEGSLFTFLTFFNGLVAPSFLFCAGFGFAISFSRKWELYVSFQPLLWRYLRRLGFILLVGYALHIPLFSLREMMALRDESVWMIFFQADILQIISLTLIAMVLLALAVRKERIFLAAVSVLTLAVVFLAPVLSAMDHTALPIWLRPYLSMQFQSQFPAFPWSAFLLSGILVGVAFVRARAGGRERTLVNRLTAGALLAIACSLLVELLPFGLYPGLDFWNGSPQFFFVRLGVVALVCILLWHIDQRRHGGGESSLLTMFGQESLLVYATHLLIVYGHTFEWSFISMFGPTLPYWQCFGLAALLSLAMYALAYAWHRLKAMNMRAAQLVQYAVIVGMVVYFVAK